MLAQRYAEDRRAPAACASAAAGLAPGPTGERESGRDKQLMNGMLLVSANLVLS
jgi:hypothetical protein